MMTGREIVCLFFEEKNGCCLVVCNLRARCRVERFSWRGGGGTKYERRASYKSANKNQRDPNSVHPPPLN
jgi:hypothetical protein